MNSDEEDGIIVRLRREDTTTTGRYASRPHQTSTKPNPKLLSFFLQAVVMAFVISLFFIFLGIAAIVLLHICLAGGALQRRRRRWRSLSSDFADENAQFGLGLSQEDLHKLPCFNYGGAFERALNRDCAVCLEGLRDGERCRILPRCKHVFHANCVDAWLIKVAACPLCRAAVESGLRFGSEDYRKLREGERGL